VSTTSCGRSVSLWAIVVTAHSGARWATMVNSSFTDCDVRATALEKQAVDTDRTYAVVPAKYDTGDLEPAFVVAAGHPNSCEEAQELMPCL